MKDAYKNMFFVSNITVEGEYNKYGTILIKIIKI